MVGCFKNRNDARDYFTMTVIYVFWSFGRHDVTKMEEWNSKILVIVRVISGNKKTRYNKVNRSIKRNGSSVWKEWKWQGLFFFLPSLLGIYSRLVVNKMDSCLLRIYVCRSRRDNLYDERFFLAPIRGTMFNL